MCFQQDDASRGSTAAEMWLKDPTLHQDNGGTGPGLWVNVMNCEAVHIMLDTAGDDQHSRLDKQTFAGLKERPAVNETSHLRYLKQTDQSEAEQEKEMSLVLCVRVEVTRRRPHPPVPTR